MAKQKVAILGGGVAGLSAAFELSRTPELREAYEVTVYQLGWRLGGKVASGRVQPGSSRYPSILAGRNLEHGLHIWFGNYENSFAMLRSVYDLLPPDPNRLLQTWRDAFHPHDDTSMGYQTDDGWTAIPIQWPGRPGTPGDGTPPSSLWGAITVFLKLAEELLHYFEHHRPEPIHLPPGTLDTERFAAAIQALEGDARSDAGCLAEAEALTLTEAARAARLWVEALGDDFKGRGDDHPPAAFALITAVDRALRAAPLDETGVIEKLVLEAINVVDAVLRGLWTDLFEPDANFESIDHLDLRAWLIQHGGDPTIVNQSPVVRQVYDTAFQYVDGSPDRPDYAAGASLGCFMNLLTGYKESILFIVQAGFGEAVVAPLYRVLVQQGVNFEFFRKVTRIGLSSDGVRVSSIRMERQADVVGGGRYEPTLTYDASGGTLESWPAEPFWEQLVNGFTMKQAGVNFESKWSAYPPAGTEVLYDGTDFDKVVLATCMGAYKTLDGVPGFCQELIAASPDFRDYVELQGIVPTISLQIWGANETLVADADLTPIVAGPRPLTVWAQMEGVLHTEPAGPVSVGYLCTALPTTLFQNPASANDTPAMGLEQVRRLSKEWLENDSRVLFPKASPGGVFDWQSLYASQALTGPARLEDQYLRANIDPTECCVATQTGTTRYRLYPGGGGFANLVVAGEAAKSGFNASSVEGSIMTGMAASRAISGSPAYIANYDMMTRKPRESG